MPSNAPDMDPVQRVLQLSTGYVLSSALHVVTKAGIPDLLENGPRSVADLATSTKSNEDALYRLMRALSIAGIFEESIPRTFSLTPASDVLRKGNPRSLRDIVTFLSDGFHLRVYA